jgi:hypothetical protein
MEVGAVRRGRLACISPEVFFGDCEQACAIKAPSLRASELCISGKRYILACVQPVHSPRDKSATPFANRSLGPDKGNADADRGHEGCKGSRGEETRVQVAAKVSLAVPEDLRLFGVIFPVATDEGSRIPRRGPG